MIHCRTVRVTRTVPCSRPPFLMGLSCEFPLFTLLLRPISRPAREEVWAGSGAPPLPPAPSLMAWTSPSCCMVKGVPDEDYLCMERK